MLTSPDEKKHYPTPIDLLTAEALYKEVSFQPFENPSALLFFSEILFNTH
jgi:hypothetical protein